MKVGYILTTFPSLSEFFAIREIETLQKSGFEITVFAAAGRIHIPSILENVKTYYRPQVFSAKSLLSIIYLTILYPFWPFKFMGLIFKLVFINRAEIKILLKNIHTIAFFIMILDKKKIHHIHAYFLNWPSCVAIAINVITNRTFSIAAHARDIFVERGALTLKISNAQFLVTCSQYGQDYLKRRLQNKYHKKLNLIYHGINCEPTLKINDESCSNKLIAVGRLVPKKGFDYLVEAFSIVKQSHECDLRIVGDGPEYQKLSTLVEKRNLHDHVKCVGWSEHDLTMQLIRASTILIVPSVIADDGDKDGIPNVVIEAFNSGIPVVTTDIGGMTEAVIHQETGLVVKQNDIAELAIAIKQLLSDKQLRQRISQNAYELMVRKFDSVKNGKKLSELFLGLNKCTKSESLIF